MSYLLFVAILYTAHEKNLAVYMWCGTKEHS